MQRRRLQKRLGRIAVVADGAHAFGAVKKGKHSGEIREFYELFFSCRKNLTTAEGGAVVWKDIEGVDNEEIYKQIYAPVSYMDNPRTHWQKHSLAPGNMTSWRPILSAI